MTSAETVGGSRFRHRRFVGTIARRSFGTIARRSFGAAAVAVAIAGALLPVAGANASVAPRPAVVGFTTAPGSTSGSASAIVRTTDGNVARARTAVLAAGGTVGADLPIVNGFAATLPVSALSELSRVDGIASITPDYEATTQSSSYNPYTDAGSSVGLSYDTGYIQYWNNGYTGAGIGVALIDSGVTPVPSLAASGKVLYGPDFTPTGYFSQQRGLDGLGHGTFMAGIIAGRNPAASAPYINNAAFVGVAPDAHVVSVKVGDYTGATTESARP